MSSTSRPASQPAPPPPQNLAAYLPELFDESITAKALRVAQRNLQAASPSAPPSPIGFPGDGRRALAAHRPGLQRHEHLVARPGVGRPRLRADNGTANNNEHALRRLKNHGLVYGDYYLVEFGNRLMKMGFV
ncbi:hypothetical protein VdG2_09050 [Verticillium dahliae VDG2]|nr:hypothetical protein VdG2_09050 [Verticillium dahliae VDG2]